MCGFHFPAFGNNNLRSRPFFNEIIPVQRSRIYDDDDDDNDGKNKTTKTTESKNELGREPRTVFCSFFCKFFLCTF